MLFAREFLLIMGLGLIVAGLTTYVIMWMVVTVHLRDKHPVERSRLGNFLFAPRAFGWFLARRHRHIPDRDLRALSLPAIIGAWSIVGGFAIVGLSWSLGQIGA